MRHGLRAAALAATLALLSAVVLGSCAPPPPGSPEAVEVAARRAAERRERQLAAIEASLVVRVDGRATGRLPAVSVQARLAAPDRMRLQVRWLLGLLLDASVRGDSLVAWMPGERLGLVVPALSDSLGVREPARFAGRALAASWLAPHEAWREARRDSAGLMLAWRERDEDWTLHVHPDGRPRELAVSRAGHEVRVRIQEWQGGAAGWPRRLELQADSGFVRIRIQTESVRAPKRARANWFALSLPGDARRLELEDLQRVLTAKGIR